MRLLISRFQVRVLGGSLQNFLQIVGELKNLRVTLELFDTNRLIIVQ